jgi:hypothetical protein
VDLLRAPPGTFLPDPAASVREVLIMASYYSGQKKGRLVTASAKECQRSLFTFEIVGYFLP